jgi:hypothetical protein
MKILLGPYGKQAFLRPDRSLMVISIAPHKVKLSSLDTSYVYKPV